MQTGQIYYSNIRGEIPTISDLKEGSFHINTFSGDIYTLLIKADIPEIYQFDQSGGDISGIETSELQKILENSVEGWRLLGADPNNYGDIGEKAVDLSYSNTIGNNGATGAHSFVTGKNNRADGFASAAIGEELLTTTDHSFCTGKYNIDELNTAFMVGTGISASERKNAFEIYNDGRIRAPQLIISHQDEEKSLISRQFIDQLIIDCGEL